MQLTLEHRTVATPTNDSDHASDPPPIATIATSDRPHLRLVAPPQRGYRGHLLIVDDDAAGREMLALFLQRRGFRVWLAESAAAARAMIIHRMPDLLLLDIGLPGQSGTHLLCALRRQRQTAVLPIIIVSAYATARDIRNGLALGADDYLTKPLELSLVEARIDAVLRRAARAQPACVEGQVAGFYAPSLNE
jgi:DNA-binding response OmpR family regulator